MTHTCHLPGCERPVPPKLLFCKPHWQMVPEHLQRAVYRHYRPGQEVDKRPTRAYLEAALAAIEAVVERERATELNLWGDP